MEPKDPKEKADELLQRCGGAGDKALVEVGLLILEQLERIVIALPAAAVSKPFIIVVPGKLSPEETVRLREEIGGYLDELQPKGPEPTLPLNGGPLAGAGRAQHIAVTETKAVRADPEAQPGG